MVPARAVSVSKKSEILLPPLCVQHGFGGHFVRIFARNFLYFSSYNTKESIEWIYMEEL